MARLSELKLVGEDCERHATPHRLPDYVGLQKDAGGTDPEVYMKRVFIERFNTGYRGVLYRWLCWIYGIDGKRVMFQVDLFPSAVIEHPSNVVKFHLGNKR